MKWGNVAIHWVVFTLARSICKGWDSPHDWRLISRLSSPSHHSTWQARFPGIPNTVHMFGHPRIICPCRYPVNTISVFSVRTFQWRERQRANEDWFKLCLRWTPSVVSWMRLGAYTVARPTAFTRWIVLAKTSEGPYSRVPGLYQETPITYINVS